MELCTQLFLGALDGLDDTELDEPALLEGWTRRHLAAHVHYNAEGLRRLVSWAATGAENRMYANPEQRTSEIEAGVKLPADKLRALLSGSAKALDTDLDALAAEAWHAQVVTAQGRTVLATEIPWMRTREVAVHAVDLDTGIGFDTLPDELNTALCVDVIRKREASGETAVLAAWLTGRTTTAPVLGPWL